MKDATEKRRIVHLDLGQDLLRKIDRLRKADGLSRVAYIRLLLNRIVNGLPVRME